MTRACSVCGHPFKLGGTIRKATGRFCSRKCRGLSERKPLEMRQAKIREWTKEYKRKERQTLLGKVSNRIRASLRQSVYYSHGGVFHKLNYGAVEARAHFQTLLSGGCAICKQPLQDEWHIAHIIPASTARSEEELLALYDLSNLTVAHPICNLQLGARPVGA